MGEMVEMDNSRLSPKVEEVEMSHSEDALGLQLNSNRCGTQTSSSPLSLPLSKLSVGKTQASD